MNTNNVTAKKAIEDIIADLESKLSHWRYSLTLLNENSFGGSSNATSAKVDTPILANNNSYSKNWSNKQKAAFILRTANRFLHISEINQMFQELESLSPNDKDALQSIRNGMGNLKQEGFASNYKASKSNQSFVWGSVKWFDANNKPKPEFMYKEGLFDKMDEEIEI